MGDDGTLFTVGRCLTGRSWRSRPGGRTRRPPIRSPWGRRRVVRQDAVLIATRPPLSSVMMFALGVSTEPGVQVVRLEPGDDRLLVVNRRGLRDPVAQGEHIARQHDGQRGSSRARASDPGGARRPDEDGAEGQQRRNFRVGASARSMLKT